MPSFKVSFGFKAKTTRQKVASKYIVIETKCEGLIFIDEQGIYKVKYKDKIYTLTTESYETRNKRIIYSRWLDDYGHRIKIIRDKDSRVGTNVKFYCAIAPGLLARGKLVKTAFSPIMFHVVTCYNLSDTEDMVLSIKQWREYEDKINNGEIDLFNEDK